MKSWDAIILGGGIIGLTLAVELRKENLRVLVIERGEPGREASHAAAGMLADSEVEDSSPLKAIATASAGMYPEFVHQLQEESGINCDLRDHGTLQLTSIRKNSLEEIEKLEPALAASNFAFMYVKERSVDPRALSSAAVRAAEQQGVDFCTGATALELLRSEGKASGIRTDKTSCDAPVIVNCLGAWAGQFGPLQLPVRPVKGQMLCLVGGPPLRHVIRSVDHGTYLVPRSDGRIVVGSTLEEVGFDKCTGAEVIRRLYATVTALVPALAQSRIAESWAGLRPGTPDNLPILGLTGVGGYFVATGHFRDGILLAPITAHLLAQLIVGKRVEYDLSSFAPTRFSELMAL